MRTETFHIGYHKTGSTFLQERVFSRLRETCYIYRQVDVDPDSRELVIPDEERRRLEAAREEGRSVVVSSEGICGGLAEDYPEAAESVARISPGARILLVIRSQYTILRSYHWLAVKAGLPLGIDDYVERIITTGKLDYLRLVEAYVDQFGRDAVKVLPFEELARDPEGFRRQVLEHLGSSEVPGPLEASPVRVSPSDLVVDAVLLANRLRNTLGLEARAAGRIRSGLMGGAFLISKWAGRIFGTKLRYRDFDRFRSALEAAYGPSNARLARLLGLDLAGHGYPLAETETPSRV
ncbi:MAG: hypothetical protein D6786_03340 [Gammaproteobacteria bacterium]|nr:MAG: hypothetical protein D6786_03340 [Gammaproteobacteria bacterium]